MPGPEAILEDCLRRYPDLQPCRSAIGHAYDLLLKTALAGGKILLCGNGGSAADSSHIAAELLKSVAKKRPLGEADRQLFGAEGKALAAKLEGGLPAISLPDFAAFHSAFANDSDAEFSFAQLAWALGKPGDALWVISTSGASRNLVHALDVARRRGMRTIGLLGRDGGRMKPLCDAAILAPGADTQQIQERHLPIYHALCLMLEETLF